MRPTKKKQGKMRRKDGKPADAAFAFLSTAQGNDWLSSSTATSPLSGVDFFPPALPCHFFRAPLTPFGSAPAHVGPATGLHGHGPVLSQHEQELMARAAYQEDLGPTSLQLAQMAHRFQVEGLYQHFVRNFREGLFLATWWSG
jgi:hypothetical protein